MENTELSRQTIAVETTVYDLIETINNSKRIEDACSHVEQFLLGMGYNLLSVKFCDTLDEHPAVRPFGKFPCAISELSKKMLSTGGCPISKEALRHLSPFDALTIDAARYTDFLSKRFLDELRKMEHKHIAVIPILIGRGLFICNVGLNQTSFKGEAREELVSVMCQVMVNLLTRFSDLATYFEPRRLSLTEAEMVLLVSNGSTVSEIAESMSLSDITVRAYLENACKRVGAKTIHHLVAKSLAWGEIPNLHAVEDSDKGHSPR